MVESDEGDMIDSFTNEHIFLISSSDPWYGDIVIYIETFNFPPNYLRDEL